MGYRQDEFDAFGMDLRTRKGRFDEGLDIIERALTGERFSYEGRYYDALGAILTPPPLQRPIPIWLGAATPVARRRIVERGHNLLISLLTDIHHTKAQFDDFRSSGGTGRTALIRECWIGDVEEVLPHLHYTYREVYAPPHAMFAVKDADGRRRQITDAADPFYDGPEFWTDRFIIGSSSGSRTRGCPTNGRCVRCGTSARTCCHAFAEVVPGHDVGAERMVAPSPVVPRFTPTKPARLNAVGERSSCADGPAAVCPPSTTRCSPVTNAASSDARTRAAPAMCSGRPISGHGWKLASRRSAVSSLPPENNGVRIPPGQIALTRIRSAASSIAAPFVRLITAAFAAE
jgi:hypothetical protein